MINRIRRALLRRKGRRLYRRILRLQARHDCGAAMIDHITGGYLSSLEDQLDAIIEKLKKMESSHEKENTNDDEN